MIPATALLTAAALAALSSPHGSGAEPRSPRVPAPRLPHSVANISDPMSHGVVGDNLLSINEAIQLHNRVLTSAQLSAAELAQLGGPGQDISWINIDASWTPTITVERDFDVILDWPHGILIQGFNGEAILDFSGPGIQHGFRSVSNFCSWRNLILQGGPYGIDLQQSDASFGGTVLDNVTFDGQSQFAFQTAGVSAGGYGRVLFDRCAFRNTPLAVRCDESPSGRTTILAAFSTEIEAATSGFDVRIGPGGSSIFQFDKCDFDVSGTGFRLARNPGDDRSATFAATHLDIRGATCMDLQGEPFGPTTLALRMLHLDATAGGTALRLGPLGASIHGSIDDSAFAGDCPLEVGRNGLLQVANCRFVGGNVTLGAMSVQALGLSSCRLQNAAITTSGQAPIAGASCAIVGGSVAGSAAAPLQLNDSYVATALGAHVSQTGARPHEHLGDLDLQATNATLGGSVTVQADLPPGLFAIFVLGLTLDTPLFVTPDLHVYLDLSNSVVPAGLFQLQQGLTLPIPNDFALLQTDWVFQAAVLPGPGVTAPLLQTPPGGRFVIR
ncbi:MAG: hypothetical protein AB7O97_05445 [Planctomycetota bacterium]